ncbi:flagellar export protein FliJ [bacterium]|nr:flagellar export protein FliJ [bacterium]
MYRFKLQALLNHRCHQEEVCQKELAEAQRDLSDAQEKLRCIKRDKRDNIQKLQAMQNERHNASEVLLFINYIEQLSRDLDSQLQQAHSASKHVTQKRDNLIAIMKKRKTLEKLKEKGWLEYQKKMMQAERKFNDEVAATRHIRKISS